MCFRRKKRGKSKVLSGRLCLRDSEAEQRTLQLLHIYCSNVESYFSAPESNKQNPPDRALYLPFFFRYKHMTSLKNLPSAPRGRYYTYFGYGDVPSGRVSIFTILV